MLLVALHPSQQPQHRRHHHQLLLQPLQHPPRQKQQRRALLPQLLVSCVALLWHYMLHVLLLLPAATGFDSASWTAPSQTASIFRLQVFTCG